MHNVKKIALTVVLSLCYSSGSSLFAQIVWTGNVDANWENTANWQGGLPVNGDNIVIDSVANYTGAKAHPSIIVSSSFMPNKINLKNGGKLFIANNLTTTRDIKVDNGSATAYQTYVNMSAGVLTINGNRSIKIKNGGGFTLTGGTIIISKDLAVETGSTFIMNENTGISNITINSDGNNKGRLKIKAKNGSNPSFNLQAGTITVNAGDKTAILLDANTQSPSTKVILNITGGSLTNFGNTSFKKSTTDNTEFIVSGGTVTLMDSIKVSYKKGIPQGCLKIKVLGGILNIQNRLMLEGLDSLIQTGGTINFNNTQDLINNGTIYCTGGTTVFQGITTLVGSSLNWQFHNVTINGTMNQLIPSNINISGNLVNNGVYSHNNKKITFNNTLNTQNIQTTTPLELFDAVVNSTNTVTISSGMVNLRNSLTLTNGLFNANGLLTVLSDSIGTARIAEITGGSITGDIIMQRYINAGSTNWRFLSSAVSGTTITDFNDDFITSGFTGSDFPLWPTPANPWASIYFYDETQPGITDSGFVAATNVTNPLAVGEGLWVWSGDTITGTQPFTIDMQGPTNTGNINLPLSYTNSGLPTDDGWNMVGNPYPSTIDWDSPAITKTGVNNAIYIWNPDLQQFASYVFGIGTNGGSRNIASSQAFWVQANSGLASVQVTEPCKTANGGTFLKPIAPAYLSIEVINSQGSDETVINFENNATIGFDGMYDALKMATVSTTLPSISTLIDTTEFSINQLPREEINIPLKITTGTSGIHQINFSGITNFTNATCLMLEDLFTGNVYNLNTTSSITTFIYDTTKTARFLIKFGAEYTISSTNVSCFGNNDGQIHVEKNSPNVFDVQLQDNSGNIISNHVNVNLYDSIINLSGGTYLIESTDNICGNRIDTVFISEPNQIIAQFTSNLDTVYLSNGGNVTFTNQSANANYYDWDFGDFSTSSLTSPSYQYTQAGNYLVSLNVSQTTNCFETFIKNITVIGTVTSIENLGSQHTTKVWINDNKLLIQANGITTIDVRNTIGQQLFVSTQSNDKQVFDLEKLNSQTLIVNVIQTDQITSTKVQFIKH